jgi:hypothetical protein
MLDVLLFNKQKDLFRPDIIGFVTLQGSRDSNNYNLLLSLLWPISDKLKYNMFLDLTQQPFKNTFYNGAVVGNIQGNPLIPQPKRRDQILMFGVQATYELFKGMEAGIHWYFIRDNSNINCIIMVATSPRSAGHGINGKYLAKNTGDLVAPG